jgi:hypothetical protein
VRFAPEIEQWVLRLVDASEPPAPELVVVLILDRQLAERVQAVEDRVDILTTAIDAVE